MQQKLVLSVVGFCVALATAAIGIQPAEIGQFCRHVSECKRSYAYMCERNRTCVCTQNFFPDPTNRKCVGGIQQQCMYDDDCIEGAFCQHQEKCVCKMNLEINDDGSACSRKLIPHTNHASKYYPGLNYVMCSLFLLLLYALPK